MNRFLYDEAKFNEKYDQYYKLVYRTAYQYLFSAEAAEDALQEAFVKLLTHKKSFNEEEHEKAWLLRVTVNICKNMLKSKANHHSELNESLRESGTDFEEISDAKIDMENELKNLTPVQRTAVFLFYFEDYSTKEISKILKMNENTVKSHLRRGRERLKNGISKEGYDEI